MSEIDLLKKLNSLEARVNDLDRNAISKDDGSWLNEAVSAGATTIKVGNIPQLAKKAGGWIVLLAGANTEMQYIASGSISGQSVTVSSLAHDHAAADGVLWIDDPRANILWFGGGTSKTPAQNAAAIQAALAATGVAYVPAGSYPCSTGVISYASYQRIFGDGFDKSLLLADGSDTLITIGSGINHISFESVGIRANTGSEHAFTGISLSVALHNSFRAFDIFNAAIGISLSGGCYFNQFYDFHLYSIYTTGILLDTDGSGNPNSNTFVLRDIEGASQAGSKGVSIASGSVNLFLGGSINHWATGIDISGGQENRFIGSWLETCTTDVSVSSGQHYIDVHSASTAAYSFSGNGEAITPGNGYFKWQGTDPRRSTYEDLKCLYMFDEDSGTFLHDYSGNNYHGVVTGGTWVDGLFGPALSIARGSDYITIPTGVIDPSSAWSMAVLFYPNSLKIFSNLILRILDGSKYLKVLVDAAGSYYNFRTWNGVDAAVTNGFNKMFHDPARWCWIILSYDPSTGTITNLDPVRGAGGTAVQTNVISSISSICLTDDDTGYTLDYGVFALWQRALTLAEAREFVNLKHPTPPARYSDLFPTGVTSGRPSNPLTGERFFDTTLGIPVWYDGANWIDAAGSTV